MVHDREGDCDTCDLHMAMEERMKMLNNIPTLLSFMNQAKGIGILAVIVISMIVGILFGSLSDFKVEVRTTQKEHEARMQNAQDKIDIQVSSIRRDVGDIKTNIAVIADRIGGKK